MSVSINVISAENMEEMTVVELRQLCLKYGITGQSKARKADIIEKLEEFFYESEEDDSYEVEEEVRPNTNAEGLAHITASIYSQNKSGTFASIVSVSCGAASGNYPVVGKTVGYVKATYKEILNIESDAGAIVNGKNVEDSYVLMSTDVLEFVRKAGQKG